MNDRGEGIDGFLIHTDVEAAELSLFVTGHLVVHRAVAVSDAFEAVIKIDQDFVEWQTADEHDAFAINRLSVLTDTALMPFAREITYFPFSKLNYSN